MGSLATYLGATLPIYETYPIYIYMSYIDCKLGLREPSAYPCICLMGHVEQREKTLSLLNLVMVGHYVEKISTVTRT